MPNKIFVFDLQKVKAVGRAREPEIKTDKFQVPADTLEQAMFRLGANFQRYSIFSTVEDAVKATTCWKWPVDAIAVSYEGKPL